MTVKTLKSLKTGRKPGLKCRSVVAKVRVFIPKFSARGGKKLHPRAYLATGDPNNKNISQEIAAHLQHPLGLIGIFSVNLRDRSIPP